jgi:membrane glycosyltransferase
MGLCFAIFSVLLLNAIMPVTAADWLYWLVLAFPLLLVSYLFTNILILSAIRMKDYTLEKTATIGRPTNVAVVLGVFNDFLPTTFEETIDAVRSEKEQNLHVDFYLASDSTLHGQIAAEEEFCVRRNVTFIHRQHRSGQRPGAINEWAKKYLSAYEYFMVLDKDSILRSPTPIGLMVRALMHPHNQDVAVFQSSIINANTSTLFSTVLGNLLIAFRIFVPRNEMFMLGKGSYWGHNGLIRREAFLDVGGFCEEHLCDDIIFTMKLDHAGWRVCYCTDAVSFEYFPSDFVSMRDRNCRWARANLGTVGYIAQNIRKTSAPVLLHALMPILCYVNVVFMFLILISGLFIPAFVTLNLLGISQSPFAFLTAGALLYLFIIALYLTARIAALGSSEGLLAIMVSNLYDLAISLNGILSIFTTVISYPYRRSKKWNPSLVHAPKRSIRECFMEMREEFTLGIFLLGIALALDNWVWIITASFYLFNFIFGPIVLYFSSKPPLDDDLWMHDFLIGRFVSPQYCSRKEPWKKGVLNG